MSGRAAEARLLFASAHNYKRTWILLLAIIFSLLLALVFTHFLHRPSSKIIAQWKQSDSITYKSFDPYYLSVIERDINWTSFPLNWERHYEIFVGRESGTPATDTASSFHFILATMPVKEATEDIRNRNSLVRVNF